VGSRLVLDLDALARSTEQLAAIADGFSDADTAVDQVTGAIGGAPETHELRAAVEHVADSWRIRREQVREEIRQLALIAGSVVEHLGDTDRDLASSLASAPRSTALLPGDPAHSARAV